MTGHSILAFALLTFLLVYHFVASLAAMKDDFTTIRNYTCAHSSDTAACMREWER